MQTKTTLKRQDKGLEVYLCKLCPSRTHKALAPQHCIKQALLHYTEGSEVWTILSYTGSLKLAWDPGNLVSQN